MVASSSNGPSSSKSWWEDYEEEYGYGDQGSGEPSSSAGFQGIEFAGLAISETGEERDDPEFGIVEPWEEEQAVQTFWGATRQPEVQDSLWDDPEPAQAATSPGIVCRVHGVICRKGICEEYANQLREQKMAKWKEEDEKNGGKKGKGKNRKRKGKGRDFGKLE
jgi:hypothetical protein